MANAYYCKKCGMVQGLYGKIPDCVICKSTELELIQPEFNINMRPKRSMEEDEGYALSMQSREKFDQAAWNHRHNVMKGRYAGRAWANGFDWHYKEGVVNVECPHCHQFWTKKISGGARLLSTSIFGLGSKKIGKQWHCYFCDSDF